MSPTGSTAAATQGYDVTERLRSDIVLGALCPGEWKRQIDLQDRYRCTRSAARTALVALASAHIVEQSPIVAFASCSPRSRRVRKSPTFG